MLSEESLQIVRLVRQGLSFKDVAERVGTTTPRANEVFWRAVKVLTYRGPETPVTRWYKENCPELIEYAFARREEPRSPSYGLIPYWHYT